MVSIIPGAQICRGKELTDNHLSFDRGWNDLADGGSIFIGGLVKISLIRDVACKVSTNIVI